MKFVIQKVTHASVTVENQMIGSIGKGFLVLIGVAETDTKEIADKLKIAEGTVKSRLSRARDKMFEILKKEEERVLIECVEVTPEIEDIQSYIAHKGAELSGFVQEKHMVRFKLADVYYFEALDEKVFAYTEDQVCEIKMRLYEVEKLMISRQYAPRMKRIVMGGNEDED